MKTWVLLRGLARESAHWGGFVHELGRALPNDRIVTLDLPGTGVHRIRASPMRIDEIVAACRAELAARRVAPPYCLLGLSLGGMVVSSWLLAGTDEIEASVLINSSMRPVSPFYERLRPTAWPRLLAAVASMRPRFSERMILGATSNQSSIRERTLAEWTAIRNSRPVSLLNSLRQLAAAARFRLPEGRPQVPVLLLCSQGDRLVNPRCTHDLARRWKCEVAVHPSAGHDLTLDAGEWVAEQIRSRFGQSTAPRATPPPLEHSRSSCTRAGS